MNVGVWDIQSEEDWGFGDEYEPVIDGWTDR